MENHVGVFVMKLNFHSKGLHFVTENLEEALLKSECFKAEHIYEQHSTWHHLLTKSSEDIQELRAVEVLKFWGMEPSVGLLQVQEVLDQRRKQYDWNTMSISEVKLTPQYQRALELVKNQFSKPFRDGSSLFPYQLETAALMIAKKRLLLALDMGLGSVLCSVTN